MAKILENLYRALALSVALVIVLVALFHAQALGIDWVNFVIRWLHVAAGILWIGLLWYFNFVQIPTMPKIPVELKPAIGKYIAPEALFWFRWAAMATFILGLAAAHQAGYLVQALTFQGSKMIGLGMWLGTIMWFNVWFIIWPNQQKALGLKPVQDDAEKTKAARMAMLTSRANFVLSLPMLYCMVAQGHFPV